MKMKLISASYLYNPGSEPLENGAVAVRNGNIEAFGKLADLKSAYQCPVDDYPGCVLMPGMVNAHTHLELTHFPAWKVRKSLDYSPKTYSDWVVQVIKLRRGTVRHELEQSVMEGVRLSMEAGTTSIGEILTDPELLHIYSDSGLSGRVYFEELGYDPVHCAERMVKLLEEISGFNVSGYLPGVSPHAPHTLSERFMKDLISFARENNLPTMIHLAESEEESDFIFNSTGRIADIIFPFVGWQQHLTPPRRMTPVQYLNSLGVLHPMTTVIHCVHITPNDVAILRGSGVNVVLCLRSNNNLDLGNPPLMLLRSSKISLSIGTDSLASNNSLSMWDEVRFLWERWPRLFRADELLEMATMGGAKALHLDGIVGSIAPSKKADIQVISIPSPSSMEKFSALILESSKIEALYLSGELRVH